MAPPLGMVPRWGWRFRMVRGSSAFFSVPATRKQRSIRARNRDNRPSHAPRHRDKSVGRWRDFFAVCATFLYPQSHSHRSPSTSEACSGAVGSAQTPLVRLLAWTATPLALVDLQTTLVRRNPRSRAHRSRLPVCIRRRTTNPVHQRCNGQTKEYRYGAPGQNTDSPSAGSRGQRSSVSCTTSYHGGWRRDPRLQHFAVQDDLHDFNIRVHRLRRVGPQQQQIGAFAALNGADFAAESQYFSIGQRSSAEDLLGVIPPLPSAAFHANPFSPGWLAYVGALGVSVPKRTRPPCAAR